MQKATFALESNPNIVYTVTRRPTEKRDTKGRIYVWNDDAVDDLATTLVGPVAALAGAPHMYTTRGEYPLVDKAWDAFNALVVATQDAHIGVVERQLGLKFERRFSKKAGCSCGCSPGFIGNEWNTDTFITVTRVAP